MTDDILARAARALREETAGDDASARFTRSRIMASVHDERVKRRTRWAFVIPIAATFVAASAFGAATGGAHHALEVVAQALGLKPSEPAPASPAPRRTSRALHSAATPTPSSPVLVPPPPAPEAEAPAVTATEAASAPAPAPAPALPPAALAAKPSLASSPEPSAPKTNLAPATPNAEPASSATTDPTFELYKAAHQAHFVDRDWGRALTAWDAYLRAAPHGALAPEARYNRALCLLRLHRNEEARAALQPFAAGRYGTYRREDAEKLIEALPPGLSGP